jgi:antitoxin (DNA-binding transcriptional repressor) of toxin-antitoxin stability system
LTRTDLDVFSAHELRNNTDQLIKDPKKGRLSIIKKHGHPKILAVPFNSQLLNLGANKSLALHLFEKYEINYLAPYLDISIYSREGLNIKIEDISGTSGEPYKNS